MPPGRLRKLTVASSILSILTALLLPMEQVHCALISLWPSSVAAHVEEHATDDDCCNDSVPPSTPAGPSDHCCYACQQMPVAMVPAAVVIATPNGESALLAEPPSSVVPIELRNASVGLAPDATTRFPPDPATSSQSPRSPPYSA